MDFSLEETISSTSPKLLAWSSNEDNIIIVSNIETKQWHAYIDRTRYVNGKFILEIMKLVWCNYSYF